MIQIAVCGPAEATREQSAAAEEIGRLLAEAGALVVCGGMGGAMDAAARGARDGGGIVVGILPGSDRRGASEHLTAAIPTAMGQGRNALVVGAADAVIAVAGEFGTLSEIALALKLGKPVIGLGTWELAKDGEPVEAIRRAATPREAVDLALQLASA